MLIILISRKILEQNYIWMFLFVCLYALCVYNPTYLPPQLVNNNNNMFSMITLTKFKVEKNVMTKTNSLPEEEVADDDGAVYLVDAW